MTYRRRPRLATCVIALASLVVALLPVIGATAAQASSAITHLWSQPLQASSQPVVGPTGSDISVNENCYVAGGNTSYVDFAAGGSQKWSISISAEQQPWCYPSSYFDAAGNSYVYMHDGPSADNNDERITSFDSGGTMRWSDLLVGGGTGVQQFALGFDGKLYALYDGNKVLQVDPTNGTGLNMGFIRDTDFDSAFTTYNDGLVLGDGGSARGYNYSGTAISTMNNDPTTYEGPVAFGAAGATYMGECTASGRVGVTHTSPLTSTRWTWLEASPSGAACPISLRLAPMPDGGVVIGFWRQDDTGLTTFVYYRISGNGTLLWNHIVTPKTKNPYSQYLRAQPIVDTNGTVVLPSQFITTTAPCLHECTHLDFVSQTDGTSAYPSLDLPGSGGEVTYAIARDRLYAAGGGVDGSSMASLDAYGITGIGSDYQTSLAPAPPQGAAIAAPAQNDLILTRQLQINLTVAGVAATSYQYGWLAPGTVGTPAPKPLQICHDPKGHCRVNYGVTTPNQTGWRLVVQGVTATGVTGPWVAAVGQDGSTSIQIPSTPILVALGDSVTAGHHRLSDASATTCEDASYGYPNYAWQTLEGELPVRWRGTGYYNYAVSGFSTGQILHGAKDPQKGNDSCGASIYTGDATPVGNAQAILHAHQTSWVRVVITAGIDDTNWGNVISNQIILHYATAVAVAALTHTSLVSYTQANCNADALHWDGYKTEKMTAIRGGVEAITKALLSPSTGDPQAQLYWLGYYNIAPPSGITLGFLSPVPSVCGPALGRASAALNSGLQAALAGIPHTWISTGPVMNQQTSLMQSFLASDSLTFATKNPPGWPHPNSAGARQIASLIDLVP